VSAHSNRLKLELRRATAPFVAWVVIAVCGLIALGWVLSNQVFERPWQSYVHVRATFQDVKGVLPAKQEVRIAGVRVGLIESEALVNATPVLTLAIDKRYAPIYRNASLRLRPQTALDDMYVELHRGTPSAGVLADNQTLPLDQTVTPVDVSSVLQSFDASTRDRLRYLLAGFGRGVADGGNGLSRAFVEAAPFLTVANRVTEQMAIRRQRLADLVARTGELTNAIGDRDAALTRFIRSTDAVLSTLARGDVPLGPTLSALPATLGSLQRAMASVGQLRTVLDPTLARLEPTAHTLDPALTALVGLSHELRPAARALDPAVTSLVPLATDLSPLSSNLRSTVTTLQPQVPDVDLATRQLGACTTAYRNFFVWTLSLFKLDDARQALGRGEVTLGPPVHTRLGAPPSQVGLSKPQPTDTTINGGLTRKPSCTEQAGLSTIPSANGTGG
jgi:virulence factor Mce-like protein